MSEATAVKFYTQVGYTKSYQKNKKHFQNGRGYGYVIYLNSWFPYDISGTAKASEVKFCTVVRQVAV